MRDFTKSVEEPTPHKAHLAATDRLIDQIGYRPCGLTVEEIRLVEGGATPAAKRLRRAALALSGFALKIRLLKSKIGN